MRAAGPLALAERLGLIVRGRTVSPCPACNAEQRSSRGRDRRGPVGLTADGLGWRCHRCGAGGDAVTMAAIVFAGTDKPLNWRPVREGLARLSGRGALLPRGGAPPSFQETRPPRSEVLELWASCKPLCDDAEASVWACARRLDPWGVADRDLARALPASATVPPWARMRGIPWTHAGYRIVLPMYDHHGQLVSLHTRNVRLDAEPKGAFPARYQVAGLVFADDVGRRLLGGGSLHGPLWIVEGVPDFLTAGTAWGDVADPWPAVLGIVSGSWTAEMASRVPEGSPVIVAVHHDRAGREYVAKIAETLGARAKLWRWIPGPATAAQ